MQSLPQNHGFSLVELLVVVSIVSILSVSAVLGFGYLGDTLRAREAVGFLQDTIRQEELKALRGDIEKATIHLLNDYLVIDERPDGASETLSLDGPCGTSEDYLIEFSDPGNLAKRNADGEVVEVRSVSGVSTQCVEGFREAKDQEWSFQLAPSNGKPPSGTLRFVHFNLQREHPENALFVKTGAGNTIEIQAPYGKKRFFGVDGKPKSQLTIDIGNENTEETLTLP